VGAVGWAARDPSQRQTGGPSHPQATGAREVHPHAGRSRSGWRCGLQYPALAATGGHLGIGRFTVGCPVGGKTRRRSPAFDHGPVQPGAYAPAGPRRRRLRQGLGRECRCSLAPARPAAAPQGRDQRPSADRDAVFGPSPGHSLTGPLRRLRAPPDPARPRFFSHYYHAL
jgi:hypothetical protein